MIRLLTTLLISTCLASPAFAATKAKKTTPPASSTERVAASTTARPVYETDGSFGFCLTDSTYPDGRKLTIAYSPNKQINIGVTIPEGKFTPGSRYDLTLGLDKNEPRKVRAETLDDETLLLQMGSNLAFRKKLAAAKTLNIGSPSNTVSFDLPAMQPRIKDLEDCIKTKASTKDERAAKAEHLMPETLKALLLTAGFSSIVPLDMDRVPENERPADFMWKTGAILSGVWERLVPDDKSLSDMVGIHIQGLKKHCPGRFNAQIGREKTANELTLRTAEVTCAPADAPQSDKAVSVALLFYLTKAQAFTVFTFEGASDQSKEARAARDQLATALLTLAKNEN